MTRALVLATALLLVGCGKPAPGGLGILSDHGSSLQAARVAAAPSRHVVTAKDVAAPALSALGPLGCYGPLGTLGPIGSNAWNPTSFMDLVGGWDGFAKQLTAHGGPLSEAGPLGPHGPVGEAYAAMPAAFRVGGDFTVLGAAGPLGALGPLGPLGPMGAHGFKRDGLGRYLDKAGTVQREVAVPYGTGERRYELVERYPGDTAAQLVDNDTSFMAEGAIDQADEADAYGMTSREAQAVTLAVVPEKQLDDFDLEVRDQAGKRLALSDSAAQIDFVQLRVAAGEKLTVRVTRRMHAHVLRASYRLVVVGATAALR